MKKRSLVASIAITAMLFGSTGTVFATDSTVSTSVSSSAQETAAQYPVYSMSVYNQITKEVEQGLLTTDEQAWARMAELDKLELPGTIQPFASYNGGILSNAVEYAALSWAIGPIDAGKAASCANKAITAAQNSGYTGVEDGKQDAFRHSYWHVLMTKEIGASQAKQAGDIHEDHNPGTAIAGQMDKWNNAAGIVIYTDHTGSTTESALITLTKTKINGGLMKYIKNGVLVWTNE
jgi:hypothetical protein